MKTVFGSLALTLILSLSAHADRPATHGMLLFGDKATYASHLPMFHAPHDYQVLLKLSLTGDPKVLAAYNAAKITAKEYFTLVPEVMDLTQVISGQKTSFKAEIFQGHFERGGKSLGSIVVSVTKVLYATKLNPSAPANGNDFFVFGEGDEYFGAHIIGGKPNYDAIVQVKGAGPFSGNLTDAKKVIYVEEGDLAD